MVSRHRVGRRVLVVVVAAVATAAVGCGSSSDSSSDSAAEPTELVGVTRTPPLQVDDVSAIENGSDGSDGPFAFRAPPGELLIVYFGYTSCPDVCPTTMSDLRAMKRDLGDDAAAVSVAMVTVDPDRDTPELMYSYVHSFIKEDVHALRAGSPEELAAIEERFLASSSVEVVDGEVEVVHTGTAYVVDDEGHIVVEWPFGTASDSMVGDVRLLLG